MILDIVLVLVLIICLVTDLKYQKIYNKVIYSTLLLSFVVHIWVAGYPGFKFYLAGFATGFGILLIPYFLGGIGAGDVKLLALIGSLKGSFFVINASIYMALIGGLIAMVIILTSRKIWSFFKGIFLWVVGVFNGSRYKLELPTTVLLKKYPYGVAIVGGAMICLFFRGAWII